MAILTIFDHNNTHIDPVKDARGCWKRGMIVTVSEDSAHDGDLVRNPIQPPWVLVKISGVTRAQVEKYIQAHLAETPDANGEYPVVRRRLYRVLLDTLPSAIRSQIVANRYVEVSVSQIRNYIENLKSGVTGE